MENTITINGSDGRPYDRHIGEKITRLGNYELWKCNAVPYFGWEEDDGNIIYNDEDVNDCCTFIHNTEEEFYDGDLVLFHHTPNDFESEEELEIYLRENPDESTTYTYYENGIYFTV